MDDMPKGKGVGESAERNAQLRVSEWMRRERLGDGSEIEGPRSTEPRGLEQDPATILAGFCAAFPSQSIRFLVDRDQGKAGRSGDPRICGQKNSSAGKRADTSQPRTFGGKRCVLEVLWRKIRLPEVCRESGAVSREGFKKLPGLTCGSAQLKTTWGREVVYNGAKTK